MSNWSRVVNTTTRRYIRDVENNLMRNRRLMALLKSKNRITYGWSGTEMEWPVEYKRNTLDGYADGDTLTFSRKERWKKAVLGWRGYSMTDAMSKMERLENSGTEAIIKVYSTIATNLVKDMEEAFSEELYINGYLAANAKRFHGIESIFGYTNTGFNVAQYVLAASQTYAGLNTQLNAYGGTWSGTWPTGRGTTEYDFWTPLIVNYGSTSFTAAPNNDWAHSAHDAMRYGIIKSRRNKSLNGQLDVLMVDDEMYRHLPGRPRRQGADHRPAERPAVGPGQARFRGRREPRRHRHLVGVRKPRERRLRLELLGDRDPQPPGSSCSSRMGRTMTSAQNHGGSVSTASATSSSTPSSRSS
jgi:hypothetical protein